MRVTGIIDWQGISIRPLFETKPAESVAVDEENLQYARLPPPDSSQEHRMLPANFEELSDAERFLASREAAQLIARNRYYKAIFDLQPTLCSVFRVM